MARRSWETCKISRVFSLSLLQVWITSKRWSCMLVQFTASLTSLELKTQQQRHTLLRHMKIFARKPAILLHLSPIWTYLPTFRNIQENRQWRWSAFMRKTDLNGPFVTWVTHCMATQWFHFTILLDLTLLVSCLDIPKSSHASAQRNPSTSLQTHNSFISCAILSRWMQITTRHPLKNCRKEE